MKLIRYLIYALILTAVLCGCGEKDSSATPEEIMAKIKIAIPEKEMIDGITYLESGDLYNGNLSEEMIAEIYGTDFGLIENYSVWIANSNVVTEIGVFKLNEASDIETFTEILKTRIEVLKEMAAGMRVEETAKAEKAVISSKGRYVYYLVTNINGILEEVILNEIEANQVTA